MLKALYDEEQLREIHLKRLIRENTEEVTDKHIRSVIDMLGSMGMGKEEMISHLMNTFDIDEKKAIEYIEEC